MILMTCEETYVEVVNINAPKRYMKEEIEILSKHSIYEQRHRKKKTLLMHERYIALVQFLDFVPLYRP